MTEEVFESVTALLNGEKDARAEYGDQHDLYNHAAEISDEDVNEMEETGCVDTIALCTSRRGLQTRRPLRLDLYFLLLYVFREFSLYLYMTITIFS